MFPAYVNPIGAGIVSSSSIFVVGATVVGATVVAFSVGATVVGVCVVGTAVVAFSVGACVVTGATVVVFSVGACVVTGATVVGSLFLNFARNSAFSLTNVFLFCDESQLIDHDIIPLIPG